ncbi:MAG: hypothetical protein COW66_06140 [Flavobacteriaceae bacterium CG18_big_fil_WC_8_21_14_2_50_34_36]|nr:MAG: hypothetical protein COW66_06140 [Flavobacteriaceae bacterium CG18_big_fil_WC_8_21_14_2_50_34_36]PIV51062.1 MAG: DUF3822 domain-containing protein [Flavobacteriaceae bacterium CG02_land_8_20_14_3_00_34_13]
METGLKNMTVRKNNNNNFQPLNRLSVQVSLNGLSFLIQNTETLEIIFFKDISFLGTYSPEEVLFEIKKAYETYPKLSENIENISILHENNLYALVPKSIFQEEAISEYLKFNTKVLPNDYITFDTLDVYDMVTVFVPFTNINNYFFEIYGAFDFYHTSTIFIQKILAEERKENLLKMHVHVFDCRFDVLVTQNKSVQLYNRFTYSTPEDFIYYILFIAEQLNMNPEVFPLYLYGKIKEGDALYTIAYTYIRNVFLPEIISSAKGMELLSKIDIQSHPLLFSN